MSNERRNISDRGGPGEQPLDRFRAWQEDRERRERGEIIDRRLDDIRTLTSEDIADLGERYGTERIAAEIAARAAVQLANVKLTTVDLPSGKKLHRVGDESHLTADDVDFLNTRMLQQARQQAHLQELKRETDVRTTLFAWVRELTGDHYERAQEVMAQLGNKRIDALLKVPKRERRAALARALEELADE